MAMKAFRRAYSEPGIEAVADDFSKRQAGYNLLWQYYTNEAFDSVSNWHGYRADNRLYRAHRNIRNPTKRLVNFYAANVYPGYVTANPKDTDSVRLAYPLPEETPQELRNALDQLWQWTNWQTGKSVLVRNTAALGDRLVEIVDKPEKGKVYIEQIYPGNVKDITLDEVGNVKAYTLEYATIDERNQPYKFRKEVDGTAFRFFRDDSPTNEYANPYGFVPACWFRHLDEGSRWGAPALRSIGKVDELNGLVSQAHDMLRKMMATPPVISNAGAGLTTLRNLGHKAAAIRASEDFDEFDLSGYQAELLDVLVSQAPTTVQTIPLDPAATLEWAKEMVAEVEADHPECTFYDQLRTMNEVSGVAVEMLMGDVDGYLVDAQTTYDQQCIKLFQMSIAIAGWRLNNGDWEADGRALNRQQEAFRPFDLASYAAGALDFTIEPRPLFRPTEKDRQELRKGELEIERMELANEGERIAQATPVDTPASVAGRIQQAAQGA